MLPFTFYRTIHLDCPVFIWRHTLKEEKIKVLALLPMELPKEIDLDNTLEAMQKFVGGLIECITYGGVRFSVPDVQKCRRRFCSV